MKEYFIKKTNFNLIAVSLVLVLVITYPYSPFLFELFLVDTRISYILYVLFSIALIINQSNKNFGNLIIPEKILYTYLFFVLIFSYAITYNPTTIRDILLLFLSLTIIIKLDSNKFIALIRFYTLLMMLLLSLSWIIYILHIFNIIDRHDWLIQNIFISENNPFILRDLRRDFEWSLLLNFTVLPFNPDFFYQRVTLIFLEPGNLSEFVFPLLMLSLLDKAFPHRGYAIFLFLISFVAAFSGWGYLVLITSIIFAGVGIICFKSANKLFLFIVLIFVAFSSNLMDSVRRYILSLLPYNKLGEYESRLEAGFFDLSNLLRSNYFGLESLDELNEVSSYGVEVIFYRYGLFGAAAFLASIILLIYFSCKVITGHKKDHSYRFYGFIGIFGTTLISFKSSSLLLIMPLFLSYYIFYINKDPL